MFLFFLKRKNQRLTVTEKEIRNCGYSIHFSRPQSGFLLQLGLVLFNLTGSLFQGWSKQIWQMEKNDSNVSIRLEIKRINKKKKNSIEGNKYVWSCESISRCGRSICDVQIKFYPSRLNPARCSWIIIISTSIICDIFIIILLQSYRFWESEEKLTVNYFKGMIQITPFTALCQPSPVNNLQKLST